eukprot:m.213868 g.213868  ORF g.213868 m.213868 type:complete len:251 (-) comp17181_c0_seq9:83-835(-)
MNTNLSNVVVADTHHTSYTSTMRAPLKPIPASLYQPLEEASICPITNKSFVWLFPLSRRKCHCNSCGMVVSLEATETDFPLSPEGMRVCRTCIATRIPQACGLTQEPWFHGVLSGELAEQRLRRPDSALGDFLVRQARHSEGEYCLSYRSTPKSVTHMVIKGKAGAWRLTYAKESVTIQALVQSSLDQDTVDRAAIAENETGHCPTCAMAMVDEVDQFCSGCGCRVRSAIGDATEYHRVGREYLQGDTAA